MGKMTPSSVLNLSGKVSGSGSFRNPECSNSTMLSGVNPPRILNSRKLQTCTLWYLPKVIVSIAYQVSGLLPAKDETMSSVHTVDVLSNFSNKYCI